MAARVLSSRFDEPSKKATKTGKLPTGRLTLAIYPPNEPMDEISLELSGRDLIGPRKAIYSLRYPNGKEEDTIARVITIAQERREERREKGRERVRVFGGGFKTLPKGELFRQGTTKDHLYAILRNEKEHNRSELEALCKEEGKTPGLIRHTLNRMAKYGGYEISIAGSSITATLKTKPKTKTPKKKK